MRLAKLSAVLIVVGLLALLVASLPSWMWHPLGLCVGTARTVRDCKGYNSWSGIFSDIGEITLIAGLITTSVAVHRFIHNHFECHEETCHKIGVHRVHDKDGKPTPFLTCWIHHPILSKHEKGSIPLEHLHEVHHSTLAELHAKYDKEL